MLKPGESFSQPGGEDSGADGAKQWTAFARNPEVLALCEYVRQRAALAKIPFGMTSGSIEEARDWFDRGAAMMTLGSDFLFMRAGATQTCTMPEKPADRNLIVGPIIRRIAVAERSCNIFLPGLHANAALIPKKRNKPRTLCKETG